MFPKGLKNWEFRNKKKRKEMRKQESEGANPDMESDSNRNGGNLKIATSDQSLVTILDDIKSSKSKVITDNNDTFYMILRNLTVLLVFVFVL